MFVPDDSWPRENTAAVLGHLDLRLTLHAGGCRRNRLYPRRRDGFTTVVALAHGPVGGVLLPTDYPTLLHFRLHDCLASLLSSEQLQKLSFTNGSYSMFLCCGCLG